MDDCRITYDGLPLFLARDEGSLIQLLCEHVLADQCDQVLVSGRSAYGTYLHGSTEISAQLGKDWSISNDEDMTEESIVSFLEKFASDAQTDRALRSIRFCPTAPRYFAAFLAQLNVACKFGLYVMGLDARSEPELGFARQFMALLGAWSDRVKGASWCAKGLVDAKSNCFTYSEKSALRLAFETGETPTNVF